jgi:hypothetical protein
VNQDEKNQAASLLQFYYIASMVWSDPEKDDEMDQWLTDVNKKMEDVAVEFYVADFNLKFAVKEVSVSLYHLKLKRHLK